MKNIKKLLIASMLTTSVLVSSSVASGEYANPAKGQKIYSKLIFNECGITCNTMAKKYTQDQWEDFYNKNQIMDILSDECPIIVKLNEKEIQVIYEYMYEHGSDSGHVAPCND
ncbi:MAG: hypothetical protein U9N30_05665 [Campylobacterota bacterium]|nr:hypothetical protein [Campylobacterota bacterium]